MDATIAVISAGMVAPALAGLILGAALVWAVFTLGAQRRKGRLKTDIAGDVLAVQYDLYARANLQPWKADEARYEWMLTPLLREIDRARRIIEGERLSAEAEASALAYHAAVRRFVSTWASTKRRRKGEGRFWAFYDETEAAALKLVGDLGRTARYRNLIKDLQDQTKPEDTGDQRPFQSLDADEPEGPTRAALV